jgi:predicted P-loop ATPase
MTATALLPNPEPALSAKAENLHKGLQAVLLPGSIVELRLPVTHKGPYSGYFNDLEAMASRAADWSGKCPAVYFTLNPVQPELLSRSNNRLKNRPKATTTDKEIIFRIWLPVDVDPIRPAEISSTDAEHAAAIAKAQKCKAWLAGKGWPAPLAGDSGNGANLLYRIELPNDEPSKVLVERVLKALAQELNDTQTKIDTGVGNAARIWKVYGTVAGKGDDTPELGRPHRVSALLETPAEIKIVSRDQLEAIAALATDSTPTRKKLATSAPTASGKLDAGAWLTQHDIAVDSQSPYQGGTKYILAECPLNSEHKKSAFLIQFPDGGIDAGCLHASCAELNWKKLREGFDADAVPAWHDQLLRTSQGGIRPVLANVLTALRSDPQWQRLLRHDLFSHSTIITRAPNWSPERKPGTAWTEFDDSQLTAELQRDGIMINSSRVAAEAAETVAKENSFDALLDYLDTLKWDGVSRLNKFLPTYFGAANNAYTCAVGACWLISGVARAREPGCKVDQILLLEGPQGILKSTGLHTLAGDAFFSDHISDIGSKDSRLEMAGVWIFELSELDRVRRGELSRIKAFFTAQTDNFRPPYGTRTQRFPRRCIFAATTNDNSSLVDESGNRRWWPVKVSAVDIVALARDRDQIWAEAVQLYEAGEKWWLDTPVLNGIAAREADLRYCPGVWDETILNWADSPEPRNKRANDNVDGELPYVSSAGKVTTADVLVHAVGKNFDKISYPDQAQVVRCLTHNGWESLPQCRVKDSVGRSMRVRFWTKKGTI